MIPLSIVLEGDNAWPDLRVRGFIEGNFVAVTVLPQGTVGGKPTVTLRIEADNVPVVLAQTTLALFLTAADVFKAKYGDPRT